LTEREILTDYLLGRIVVSDDYNFRFYLQECIMVLPWDDLKTIAYERNINFIATTKSTAISLEPILYNQGKGDMVLVVFVANFSKLPPHEIRYIIAHELAHVFLGHYNRNHWRGEESERDADRQVIAWGLEEELKQAGCNYLKKS
jgi:hypothetical protein